MKSEDLPRDACRKASDQVGDRMRYLSCGMSSGAGATAPPHVHKPEDE